MTYPEKRYLTAMLAWIMWEYGKSVGEDNAETMLTNALADGWIITIIEDGRRVIHVTDKGREQMEWLIPQIDQIDKERN